MDKKVVIITGAASGIGRATALTFAANGYCLMLSDIDAEALLTLRDRLKKEYGADCTDCPGDLGDETYLQQVVNQTIRQWNRIDVLVNNAAWRTVETMRTIELSTWEKTLRVCLTAPAYLTKWVAADMESRAVRGVIVNVSSIMAGRPAGTSPAYIAAKGALESLTRELAITYGRSGIRVVGVAPGSIDTPLNNDYKTSDGNPIGSQLLDEATAFTPLGSTGKPQQIADAIYWLSTEQASFITGTTLLIDGGLAQNFSSYTSKKVQFPNEF